jgi:putative ABC transport system permease protein
MKLIDILKTANGNLLQSKLRTFLTVIAVFIGAFTLTLTSGMGAGISKYINDQVAALGASNVLIVQVKQDSSFGGSSGPKKYDPAKVTVTGGFGGGSGVTFSALTPKDLTTISGVAGISKVEPVLSPTVAYAFGPNSDKYTFSAATLIHGTTLAMQSGAQPDVDATAYQLALPETYVTPFGFTSDADAVGKTVTIGVADPSGAVTELVATVTGVPEKSLISDSGASVNTSLTKAIMAISQAGLPTASTQRFVNATAVFDSSYTDAQVTELKSRLDKLGYTGQTVADRLGVIQKVISAIVGVFDLFGVIALLAASFGVINTLLMAVQERTREIGLMKAMGMSAGRIYLLFSAEAILLGFWGSALGVLFAVVVGKIINQVASNGFLKDFPGLQLLTFPARSIIEIILIIMLVAFLAGTLPARRASKLNPIDALRYE